MDSSEHGPAMSSTGVASGWNPPPGLTEEEAEEMQVELIKVEDEIETLRQVLVAKERHAAELKRRLGIGPLSEIKQNLTKGWHEVQCSNAYKRTQETLSQAGQMTSAAFSSMGSAIRNQFGEMRNSPSFKTFEDKVENMKYKVMGQTNEESDRSPTSNNAP
ncbi:tumor protein D54-like isoform X7 [Carassius auratus]|uniref:Tumor protein D54-like isoform X7 n=1 Tax=Carassius auratus TaxID=7957 RepID=A0A6P6N9N4_CARAU|nr:tumor protein D54-like isoform X7 [Carassius auratus]XP_052460357.1 tumor protein D54 isoform X9 [Carassius gibelio]